MTPETQTPPGQAGLGCGFGYSEQPKSTPTPEAAQCGKRAAIQAYSNGWISLESCAELFRANPLWRGA